MRTSLFGLTLASALLVGGAAIAKNKAQDTQQSTTATTQSEEHSQTATKTREKADVTYGRIKELQAGQKVVVDIDNHPDKSFDLTDKDTKVNMPSSLKVGDPVKITERDQNGKKMVRIARDTSAVKHGDKTAAGETRSSRHEVRTDTESGTTHEKSETPPKR